MKDAPYIKIDEETTTVNRNLENMNSQSKNTILNSQSKNSILFLPSITSHRTITRNVEGSVKSSERLRVNSNMSRFQAKKLSEMKEGINLRNMKKHSI